MRIPLDHDPYQDQPGSQELWGSGTWPCRWLRCPGAGEPPFVSAYRLRFQAPHSALVRVHVSADERYELFLDGQRIGRGSERGDGRRYCCAA